jgi:hypothetical protein
MNRPRNEPLRFTRGRRLYQIVRSYLGDDGYLGICDGRVVARGVDRVEVARVLIAQTTGAA